MLEDPKKDFLICHHSNSDWICYHIPIRWVIDIANEYRLEKWTIAKYNNELEQHHDISLLSHPLSYYLHSSSFCFLDESDGFQCFQPDVIDVNNLLFPSNMQSLSLSHTQSFISFCFQQTNYNEGNKPPPGADRGDVSKGGRFPAVSPPNPGAGGGNRAPIPAFCGNPGPAGMLGNGLGPGTAEL